MKLINKNEKKLLETIQHREEKTQFHVQNNILNKVQIILKKHENLKIR